MMSDFLSQNYLIIKALHLICVISWMAALLYLPRLFVYHVESIPDTAMANQFIVMENRLAKFIMTPAMISTFIFGILLLMVPGMMSAPSGWLHAKIIFVLILAGFHGFLIRCMGQLRRGNYPFSGRTFRFLNEVPALIMIFIIFLVVLKPF